MHQRKMSLDFVRRIDEICCQSGAGGDPIVIVGAGGGGTGRRGRAQCKHDVLLKTLAGFFTVVMLNEHCTSKKTTCCHQDAHVPRSKGRSRGCKNKACAEQRQEGKPPWWDRDTGRPGDFVLSVFVFVLSDRARLSLSQEHALCIYFFVADGRASDSNGQGRQNEPISKCRVCWFLSRF